MENRIQNAPDAQGTDRKRGLRGRLRTLGRDVRGATILEFALISAPFFALIIAILETSLVFLAQQGLETTGEAASRLIMTGQAQQNGWTTAQYKTQVCNQLPPFLSCSNLMIDVQTAASFSTASTAAPTMTYTNGKPSNAWQYQTGTAGAIVIVRLMYLWPIATGPLSFNLSNQPNSKRLLIATSVAQTEPYTS